MGSKVAKVRKTVGDILHTHWIRLFVVLVTLVAFATLARPASAGPLHDSHSGTIVSLETEESLYNPEDEAVILFEVENDSDVKIEYRAEVIVLDPSGRKAYDSERVIDAKISLRSGSSRIYKFYWQISDRAEEGKYTLSGVLKDWDDSDTVYAETTVDFTFEVIIAPEISLSTKKLVIPFEVDKVPEARVDVRNTGDGVLEWEVTDWPEDWVVIVRPTSKVTGPGTIRVRAKRSSPWPTDPEKPITITWNNGTEEVFLKSSAEPSGSAFIWTSELEYRAGDDIFVHYQARNNRSPELTQDYRVSLRIFDPEGDLIFDSSADPGEIESPFTFTPSRPVYTFSTEFGGTGFGTIRLLSQGDVPIGKYTISETLYQRWPDSSIPEKRVGNFATVFEILEGTRLTVEPDSWDFGTVTQGDTPTARFTAFNGTEYGTLTWNVADWPDWIKLVSPKSEVSGADNIRLSVNEDVSPGIHRGDVTITSNAGSRTIKMSVKVLGLEPTDTPMPTATPPTPVTPESSQPTSTPTAVTPTPETTETSQPTSTPTAPAIASAPTSTPTAPAIASPPTPMPPTTAPALPPIVTFTAEALPQTSTTAPSLVQVQSPALPTATAVVVSAVNPVEPSNPPQGSSQTPAPVPPIAGCNSPLTHIPFSAGLANLLIWVAPLAMISGYRRAKHSHLSPTGISAVLSRIRRKTRRATR